MYLLTAHFQEIPERTYRYHTVNGLLTAVEVMIRSRIAFSIDYQ